MVKLKSRVQLKLKAHLRLTYLKILHGVFVGFPLNFVVVAVVEIGNTNQQGTNLLNHVTEIDCLTDSSFHAICFGTVENMRHVGISAHKLSVSSGPEDSEWH